MQGRLVLSEGPAQINHQSVVGGDGPLPARVFAGHMVNWINGSSKA
jgi:uncharacterized membrane protein